ncbi:hypothetical protein GZ998_07785 [Actinomyces sp. 594]|uniref:hypothetical protein n=1 Tax=Actinomyces sp. 594 TaxID=2057793 RepID=UPI001C569FDD|nr:hypothetical protein [Actinomyces sp. 594]MBW3069400.1 hypothetical protein [Actinomyces sp. 594]
MALLLAACSVTPLLGRDAQPDSTQDARFAEFTQYVPDPLTVQTSLDSVTSRMPAMGATGVHFVGQYRVNKGEWPLPEPDRPYWFHAVVEVDQATSRALGDAATSTPDLLPPIHPDLRQYVPRDCTFVTVPESDANRILDTENADLVGGSERFTVDELALSTDCDLVVMVGTGHYS